MKHTKKKKLLAFVLCMVLVLSTAITAFAVDGNFYYVPKDTVELSHEIIHFLRREMLDFTAFPVFFVSNLLLVQRKKYYFNRATVSRNCSIVL